MINQLKKIATDWNKLKTDEERFNFLLENKGTILTLMLDNDYTFVDYNKKVLESVGLDPYDAEQFLPELNAFSDYLGWSEGVKILLKCVGLGYEEV